MPRHSFLHYKQKRLAAEPFPTEPAPAVSSSSFKTSAMTDKPKAKLWDDTWSIECQARRGSTLKAMGGSGSNAGNRNSQHREVSLSIGRPAPELYPWKATSASGLDQPIKRDFALDGDRDSLRDATYPLYIALNYGSAVGSPQLLRFVTEHVELIHNPPYVDWECCLTSGNTSAFEIAFRMFCDRGDFMFVESHSYSGALEAATVLGVRPVGLEMDCQGLVPSVLERKLREWDDTIGKRPRLLYTIPSGQNPTGATQSTERRKAIYDIAEEHNLFIIEDDPYYFLQLKCASSDTTIDEYPKLLPPSYLSLDTSGRVLRLDSTAKILAPGLRCAWMTASAQVVEKFRAYVDATTVAPSGLSQLAMYELLDLKWGHEGFLKWLITLSDQYRQRCNAILLACERHLPSEYCRWDAPSAGMFLWVHVDPIHDRETGVIDSLRNEHMSNPEDQIYRKAKENGVVVSKGSWFAAESGVPQSLCFRLTFAAAAVESFDWAVMQFASAVKEVFSTYEQLEMGVLNM